MSAQNRNYSIVLHAGAAESWHSNTESHRRTKAFLESLIEKARIELCNGAAAIDVVTDVTAALEDHPDFNAGKGSALNIEGFHELEAAVIDGRTCEYRAAIGLRRTKNPIKLAKAMLSSTGSCLIMGSAADALAGQEGLDMVENSYYTTSKRKGYWDTNIARVGPSSEGHGTVGAVALDVYGNLGAANSTGGTMFKSVGRVGDTAIIGAGIYADDKVAIVCSGSGEAILKAMVASQAASKLSRCASLSDAIRGSVLRSAQLFPTSSCGVIAVHREGDISIHCNSRLFAIASAGSHIPTIAGVIRSTIPLLKQLVVFEDDFLAVALAKYPTMANQLTAELKRTSCVAALELDAFLDVFSKLRIIAESSSHYFGIVDCGIIMSTPTEAHLYHFTSPMSSFPCSTGSEAGISNGERVIVITEQMDEYCSAETRMFPEEEDVLARIELFPAIPFYKADTFPLFHKAFIILWRTLQVLITEHNKDPTSLRLKIEPIYRTNELEPISSKGLRASVFRSDFSHGSPLNDPCPAAYHAHYPGYMETRLGSRAQNLAELPTVAEQLSAQMKSFTANGVGPALVGVN